MQPLDCQMCNTNICGLAVEAHFESGAMSVSFALLAITPTNTFTLEGQGNRAL